MLTTVTPIWAPLRRKQWLVRKKTHYFYFVWVILSKSCLPPKKSFFRAKSAGVEEEKNPASSEQNAGTPEHALTVLSSRSKLRQRCLLVYIHLIQVNLLRGAEVLTIHCQHRPCPMREPVAGGVRTCTEFFNCVKEIAGAKGIDFC